MTNIDSTETREEKFRRLATIRVNNALKDIELIGNLSNKSAYKYSDESVKKIFIELDRALRVSKDRFSVTQKGKSRFSL